MKAEERMIDKQLFGVPIAHVVQIVGMQKITEVPELPHYAKGIINLRGSIILSRKVRIALYMQYCESCRGHFALFSGLCTFCNYSNVSSE